VIRFFSYQPAGDRSRTLFTRVGLFIALLTGPIVAPDVQAVTPARLIGPDLVSQPVTIAGLNDETLTYFDEKRILRSAAVDAFVQLRAIGGAQDTAAPYPCVVLTDGQRFTGDWVGPSPDGNAMRWRHDLIGEIVIPLDELANVIWRGGDDLPAPAETPATDTLTFINGDTISGFVSMLNDWGVVMVPDAGGAAVTIPYARIASLSLANPQRRVAELYHLVTLADGTRVWADEMRLSSDTASWLATPPGASPVRVETPVAELARIDFRTGGMSLIDLTDLSLTVGPDTGVFGLSIPARVEGRAIRAHAPATLTFDLPEGAARFAALAELDTADAPDTIGKWADFQIVLLTDSAEVGRWHIDGTEPRALINAPVTGRELTICLEPGVNGPILDRLRMSDAVVLVQLEPAEPTGAAGR
jgi:hypothetical protein